jgi:hypothetical protein
MDVQTLLDQERDLRQFQSQENAVKEMRSQENLQLKERERNRWLAGELERRAWAASGPGAILSQAFALRPFGDLTFRMAEQSRRFQKFTDLTSFTIGKAVSDAVKVGETYRRLIDPIPAMESVLKPFTVAPSFDAMRYVTPLVEFERQFNALRDQSFFRFNDLRSKVSDTILGLSRVVGLATAYVENPPVALPESYADFSLSDVVDFVGEAVESNAEPDWLEVTEFLQRIEARLSAVELKLSTPSFRDNVTFWLGVIGFLIAVLSLCVQFGQNSRQLPDQKQPAVLQSPTPARPTAADLYVGPCP